jgi:hypothetical protein
MSFGLLRHNYVLLADQCCQMVYFNIKNINFGGPWNGKSSYIL